MSLTSKLLIGALVVVGVLALPALERQHDREHCRDWTPYREVEPEYYKRAVDLCFEGRQAYLSGPFGLLGPSVKGELLGGARSAGRR